MALNFFSDWIRHLILTTAHDAALQAYFFKKSPFGDL